MKLLIVGVDGYSDRVFYDLELPASFVKTRLMPKSLFGRSKPSVQRDKSGKLAPHTGPNWSSIYTGVTPKIHGVDYGGWLNDQMSHGDLKVRSIWYEIRDHYKLGMIGMPITYPAFKCEWMISGFPNSRITENSVYPKDLKLGKGFKVDYGDGITSWRDDLIKNWDRGEYEKFVGIEDEKVDLAIKLNAVNPVDVLAFGTTIVDKSCHLFSLFSPQSFKIYKKVDSIIKRLFEAFNPEQMIVLSDHGFMAIKPIHNDKGFYLWYEESQTSSELRSIEIIETTKMILSALKLDIGMIGHKQGEKKYKQEDKDFILHNMKELGYL